MDGSIFEAIAEAAHGRLQQFDSQNVANLAWACAAIALRKEKLLEALATHARQLVAEGACEALSIANLLWAYASLAFVDLPLLTTLSGAAVQQGWEFSPPSLSNTAWALAVLLVHDTPVLTVISEVALMLVNELESQGVSIAAWAFASPGVR